MSSNDPNSYGTDDAFDEYIDMDFLKSDTMEEDVDIGNMSTSDLFRYYLEGELARDATNLDSSIYATPMQNASDDFSMVTSPNSVTEEPQMNSINLIEESNALSQSTNVSNEVGPSLAMLNAQLAELLSKLPSFKQESHTDGKAPTLSGSTLPVKNNPQSNVLAALKLSATPNNNKESEHSKLDDSAQIDLKKLSSKERRQLRNKISARNFRVRRKESTKEQQQEEINLLRQALMHLQEENTRLKQEVEELRKQQKQANKPVINSPPSPPHNSTLTSRSNAQRSKASQPSSSDPRYLIPDVNKDKLSSSSPANQIALQDPRVRVQTTLIPEFNLDKHLFEEKSAFPYSSIWNDSMVGQPSLRDVIAFDQRTLFAYMLITTVMQRLTTLFIEAVCATPQNKMISALFPPETLTESLQSLEIVDEKDDNNPMVESIKEASVLDWLYDTMVKHVAEQSKVEARIMELSDWVGEEWDDTVLPFLF
ncbi:14204_t:CDS:2 [Racocetra fulgida]|uniref:14204_t:CDS:1 n=1 Tax=Racocetra fulgida TaxID=60492 RepID=A0A9N9D176_9GLOM|nr:14204_t:CDS:2 [Racocetra fulgida]